MSNQLYKLELVPGYPNDTHHRAGLLLSKGGSLVTELSKDQLEAVKNDSSITLSKAEDGEQSQTPGISDQGEGAGVADIAQVGADKPDRSASEEDEAVEDLGGESEEENAGQDQGADGEGVADEATEESAAEDAAASSESTDEAEAAAQSTADQLPADGAENAAGDAPVQTAEDLARDNDRPTLNKLALEAGVVEPEKLQNKLEVAAALIEKRA